MVLEVLYLTRFVSKLDFIVELLDYKVIKIILQLFISWRLKADQAAFKIPSKVNSKQLPNCYH